jgi:DNA-binding GntR family transcriptional regulator
MSRHSPLATAQLRIHPLYSGKKGDAAYHLVRRSILLGHLRAGESLLEQRIAAQLNCSQGTVREALLRLEQDGLVSRRGYRGTVVSTTSIHEVAQMVQIRVQIECAAIRRAAGALSPAAVAELRGITEEMDEAVGALDFYRCSELDRRFHLTLCGLSELPALEPLLNRCALHIHRFTYRDAENLEPETTLGEKHRALLEIFALDGPDAAADAIRRHINEVIERWAPPIGQEVRRLYADGATNVPEVSTV